MKRPEVAVVVAPAGAEQSAPQVCEAAQQVWSIAATRLRNALKPEVYAQWFENIAVVGMDGSQMALGVPDDYFAEWLNGSFSDAIASSLADIDGVDYTFELKTGYAPVKQEHKPRAAARPAQAAAAPSGTSNDPFTFDNFVVGEENRYAFAAARAAAESPGKFNPLYIYGDTGIGKTHLIRAVRHELLRRQPGWTVRYASCEEILNDFVDSLYRAKDPRQFSEFRSSLRKVDALLVDDIHALAKKTELQEQFFNAFNELYMSGKQIILTSDQQPCEIEGLERRLTSRFEVGMTTELLPPGYEVRLAILRQSANEYLAGGIDSDVLNFLAMNIASNVRRLKGALLRVIGYSSATGEKITVSMAERLLHSVLEDENSAKSVSFEDIQSKVAAHFGLRLNDILSNRRPRNVAEPRMVAMYLCRKLTDASYPEIGAAFGKNHATILNAMKKVPQLCNASESMRRSVDLLERQLKKN
ncbi:MAG: chromosomal replication initiator protein DnaA [Victivallaceae bacterium]|nr:chromosomal replication initiator protein DnaA [Victivallaceae bacterium]